MFSVDELLKQQQQQQQFVEGNNGEQVLPKGFDTSNITSSDSNGNGYYMGVNTSMMKYLSSAFGPVAAESTGNNFKIGNFNQKIIHALELVLFCYLIFALIDSF